jgi:acyl carrier protein
MSEQELRQTILDVLCEIAPEVDPATVPADKDLREALDLDSMDFLNVTIALHERLGVDIPEADAPKLYTLEGGIAYLRAKLAAATQAQGRSSGTIEGKSASG